MRKEYLYAGIAILAWSTTATVSKLLLGSLSSLQVLFLSTVFASLFLFLLAAIRGKLPLLKTYRFKDFAALAGLGLIGIFSNKFFYYLGTARMDASRAFAINYLWPLLTVVFACLILKEKFTIKKMLAVLLSFIGVVVITLDGNFASFQSESLLGPLFIVLDAISYALFSVLNKKMNYDGLTSMLIFQLSACAVSGIGCLLTDTWTAPNLEGWLGLGWIGIVTSGIAYTAWASALQKGDTGKVSNLAYITPFLSLVWTTLILDESITVWSILGLLLIVSGVFVQMTRRKKKEEREPSDEG